MDYRIVNSLLFFRERMNKSPTVGKKVLVAFSSRADYTGIRMKRECNAMEHTKPGGITDSLKMKLISFHVLPTMMVIFQLIALWVSSRISLFPGEEELKSIVSSFAEIIAGLYGITLASYTFFLSRIDALTATDATLDYVVDSIKRRFKYLIWYITANVLLLLCVSMVLMYCSAPEGEELGFLYRLACNEFMLFAVFSVGLILYYSILVIDPNCIAKHAAKLKRKLGGRFYKPGSVVEFIGLYSRIEEVCNGMLPEPVLTQLHENKGKHFELTLELMADRNPGLLPLIYDLTRIHRYYECVLNCSKLSVSEEMCKLARNTLERLEKLPAVQGLRTL